jgi:SAM-dependent methyltransferase
VDDEDGYFGERVAARYDDPSSDMFQPSVVDAAVDVLAELAGGCRALELGIGTGRIALPLARREVPVHGIDLSRAMVARLRAKPGSALDFLRPDEHFVLVGAGREMSRAQARRVGRAAAHQLGWDDPGDTLARHLSGGTRQKLNLTMSTLTEPDLLLLDEPYQGFDRGTYVNFWDDLWRLRDAGKAIVLVTHLLTQLDRVDLVLDLTPAPVGSTAR